MTDKKDSKKLKEVGDLLPLEANPRFKLFS
jgi:hypothetical protein